MDTLLIEITQSVRDALEIATAHDLAYRACDKFDGDRTGKFNRYSVIDKYGKPARFLIIFEGNSMAVVMTYEEAMLLPTLAQQCREIWGDK